MHVKYTGGVGGKEELLIHMVEVNPLNQFAPQG